MIRTGLLVFVMLFFTSNISAQQGALSFNRLTLEDGLSETRNANIYLDVNGFVWINSVDGLNRFDGHEVKVYKDSTDDSCSIKGNLVTSSFFEDTSSRMWFTSFNAINAYDWNTDCFHHYTITLEKDTLKGYYAFYLDPDQNLWLVADKYLYTFNTQTANFNKIDDIPDVNRAIVCPDSKGHVINIWIYTVNQAGAYQITIDNKHEVISKKIVWETIASKPFLTKDMICQGDSLLWVLSDNAIWKFNVLKNEGQFIPLRQTEATSFDFMDDKTLLVGFKKTGLREFSLVEEKLTYQYSHFADNTTSVLSNQVDEIYKDPKGNIWVSSWGKGISYTQPKNRKFNTFYPRYLHPGIESFHPVALFPVSPDVLMCATRTDGFYYLHRKKAGPPEITKVPLLDSKSVPGNVGDVFKDDAGYYWISSYPGLSVFDPFTGDIRNINALKTSKLRGIPWSNQARLFCGGGLFEVRGNIKDGFSLEMKPFIQDTVTSSSIFKDSKERLWIGKGMEALMVFDSKNFNLLATIPINGYASKIIERDSSYWISSPDGLFEVNMDSLTVVKMHSNNERLLSSGFSSMVMDGGKRLWLTYNEGIVMFDPGKDSIRIFNKEDGLPPLQFTTPAYQFDDGEIWFTAYEGITHFYPNEVHALEIDAIPQITEIQVNDSLPKNKLVCKITGSSNFALIQKLTLKYADNTLAFRINSLEYSGPSRTKVKYQMVNLDAQQLETSSGSLVRYPNLPPGDYKFVVFAANSDGIYSDASRTILIHINAPFYKTWWFYVLVALSAIGIVAYIIYLRFTKALELQRVRLKLYENLHDDVGSRLTAIVLSAEDLERNEKIDSPKIQSISKIAKSIVENMRRLVWAIDPENDKMNNIVQKITHDKSLILGDGIAFHVHIDDHLKNVVLAGEVRYQISSISNEAFNNIAKYAQATEVNVSLSRENKKLRLVIADNGKGFDPALVTKNNLTGSGYGLNNMKRRASRVKGNLEIFSKSGEGTRIEAEFPY